MTRTSVQLSHRGREPRNDPGRTVPREGVARVRYANGALASEHRFKDGLLHGLCREWDEKGNLLGEYRMVHGTGVQREWHDNGRLKIEVSTVRGEFCGRNRIWLRDGTLISERFYVRGQQVTPAEYASATAEDDSLPRYPESAAKRPARTPVAQRRIHKVFVQGLLQREDLQEARSWLAHEQATNTKRLVGRFGTEKDSASFLESLYEAGADEVLIPRVHQDKLGNQFAEALLVRLPKNRSSRSRIREACSLLRAKGLGSCQPDTDLGEHHLYLWLG